MSLEDKTDSKAELGVVRGAEGEEGWRRMGMTTARSVNSAKHVLTAVVDALRTLFRESAYRLPEAPVLVTGGRPERGTFPR